MRDEDRSWEEMLGQGLDSLTDLGEEEPPDLAALQMLVAEVQVEQRRSLYRDLVRFWGVAALLLLGMLYGLYQAPIYFLLLQGGLGLFLLIGAGLWQLGERGLRHE